MASGEILSCWSAEVQQLESINMEISNELPSPPAGWSVAQSELRRFIYSRVRDSFTTDDILQDVFIKVHTRFGQLRDSDKLKSWLFQIARNSITDHFRAQKKTITDTELRWDSEGPGLNDCVSYCLQEMLLTLPEKYRVALDLAEIQGLSQIELAKRLNVSYSGAKSRVQRARLMLKEKMAEQYRIKTDRYGNVVVCENKLPCNCPQSFSES